MGGDNCGATGMVYLAGSGSVLSGKGSVGGDVFMFGNSTFTANDTTNVGTMTLLQNVKAAPPILSAELPLFQWFEIISVGYKPRPDRCRWSHSFPAQSRYRSPAAGE